MYQVLIAVNDPDMQSKLKSRINWQEMHFRPPFIASTADEAITLMESKRVDCAAYMLTTDEARTLSIYLNNFRPSLPLFELRQNLQEQIKSLEDVRAVLNRLHMDISDEEIDPETLFDMLRDELFHKLLVGEITDDNVLRGRLPLLRSSISADSACIMYDFDLPQGEVYLSSQWHYGSERPENALRVNFFGRYYENLYYMVAVLTPRHIRLVACQRMGETMPDALLAERADKRVNDVLENIKEYLNLDMLLTSRQLLPSLYDLVAAPECE